MTKKDAAITGLPRHIEIKIKAVYSSLKSAEKKAADFFAEEPEKVKTMTISNLAHSAGCSEATICRFAKKLGYETYSELKEEIVNSEGGKPVGIINSYSGDDSVKEILKKTFDLSIQALQDTYNALDLEQLEGACRALEKARFVLCVGVGDAEAVAKTIYSKLIRIGRHVNYASDTDTMNILCAHLTKDDLLICISHSGRTRNVANVASRARKKGATVIAITNFPMSQLAKRADYSLFTASFAESFNGEIISKRIAEMCIVEAMFISLIRKNEAYLNAMNESNESISGNKY